MLLIPSNMVFSKVQSWNDVNECERNNNNNNNSVKNDILRTPPRCMCILFILIKKNISLFYFLLFCVKLYFLASAICTRMYLDIWFPWSIFSLCPTHLLSFKQMVFFDLVSIFWFHKKYHFIPYFTKIYFTKKIPFCPILLSTFFCYLLTMCVGWMCIVKPEKCIAWKNAKSLMLFRDA